MALTFRDIIELYGDNPFTTFIFIMKHGGLWIVYPFFVHGLVKGWLEWIREKVKHKRKYVLMSVNVPKENEQSMKAVEQIYAQIYGTKRNPTWTEKYWQGWTQALISFEIESDGGYIQFYIRCWEKHQDVVETAIYAQYPDAEISKIEKEQDYVNKLNVDMIIDKTHDLYGADLVLENKDIYSIRNWRGWEHSLPGKFIDPMAAMLEIMSRMQPGEHLWFQVMTQPLDLTHLNNECQKQIDKFIGESKNQGANILDKIVDFPIKLVTFISDNIFGGAETATYEAKKESKRIFLVEYEREAVSELDMKRSRWPYLSKVRFIYFANRDIYNQEKARRGFIGAMRQFKFLNSFKEGDYTKVDLDDTYWFDNYVQPWKKRRLFWRRRRLIWNYKAMDMERGETEGYALSCEELTSLYHFPQIDVRAPFVQKAESRRVEPPTQLDLEQAGGAQQPTAKVEMEPIEATPQTAPLIMQQTPEQAAYHEKLQREQGYKPMDNVDGTTAWPAGETPETITQPTPPRPIITQPPQATKEPGAPPPNLPIA